MTFAIGLETHPPMNGPIEHSWRERGRNTPATFFKFRNEAFDHLSNRSRLVFIDIGQSGFAAPFLFLPFHHGAYNGSATQ